MANRPNGARVYVKPKIGSKVRPCRVKSGTARFLGLVVADIEKGRGNSIKRGAVGTKSFTLLLRKSASVGGARVKSLDFPVPGDVKVLEFYKWAKSFPKLGGIVTPDGISYTWAKIARGGGGGFNLPDLPSLPNLPGGGTLDARDIIDIVDGITDVLRGVNPAVALIETSVDIVKD